MIHLPPTLPLIPAKEAQKHARHLECRRRFAIGWLETKWLLHPENYIARKSK